MLADDIKQIVAGEVSDADDELARASRDASIFSVRPSLVVYPQNLDDIQKLVRWVGQNKSARPELSLTARAAGTCMSGGSLSESIVLGTTQHMDKVLEVGEDLPGSGTGVCGSEPGVYYRDFEMETKKK